MMKIFETNQEQISRSLYHMGMLICKDVVGRDSALAIVGRALGFYTMRGTILGSWEHHLRIMLQPRTDK